MAQIKGAENYTVFGFMTRGLGLSGAELQVYAVIYSFSRDGVGTFSGSRAYLAATVGFSERTVTRALGTLLDKGYIKRSRGNHPSAHIYSVDMKTAKSARQNVTLQEGQNVTLQDGQNVSDGEPNWREGGDKMSTNNKDDNKEIINTSPPPPPLSARREGECAHTQKKKNNGVFKETNGKWKGGATRVSDTEDEDDEYIMLKCIECAAFDHYLTYEQYEHLCDIVDERTVLDYFGRLDGYMYENRNARPHSEYRTILKWIKEDFGDIEK